MTDSPIYRQLANEQLAAEMEIAGPPAVPHSELMDRQEPALASLPEGQVRYGGATDWAWPTVEPFARTAGEQDHADPWVYAGDDAAAPEAV